MAFFPGMMNADSLYMWGGAVYGNIDELHTGFVPIIYSLLARLWNTPGVVGLAQIIFFGGVLHFLFSTFEGLKAPRWLLGAISAVLALSPMVGANLVTLEKDIPFGVLILLLSGCCIRIVESGGAWLEKKRSILILALGSALLSLCRHEGIFPALGLLMAVLVCYVRFWRSVLVAAVIGSLIVVFVQWPVYDAFKVVRNKQYNRVQLKCIDLSVIYYKNGQLSEAEKEFIREIMPLEEWRGWFNIYTPDTIIYTPGMARIFTREKEISEVWKRVWLKNWPLLARYRPKMASIIWQPFEPRGAWTYGVHVNEVPEAIDRNEMGIELAHLAPGCESFLRWLVKNTSKPILKSIFYRPALYLWISLLSIVAASYITRNFRVLLIGVPVALHTFLMFLFVAAQHSRYIFHVFLVFPFVVAYLVIKWRTHGKVALHGGRLQLIQDPPSAG